MGMATVEMVWETNAKVSWCHVAGFSSLPEHPIVEGKDNGKARHYCPRCGMWLEPKIGRRYGMLVEDDLVAYQAPCDAEALAEVYWHMRRPEGE